MRVSSILLWCEPLGDTLFALVHTITIIYTFCARALYNIPNMYIAQPSYDFTISPLCLTKIFFKKSGVTLQNFQMFKNSRVTPAFRGVHGCGSTYEPADPNRTNS